MTRNAGECSKTADSEPGPGRRQHTGPCRSAARRGLGGLARAVRTPERLEQKWDVSHHEKHHYERYQQRNQSAAYSLDG